MSKPRGIIIFGANGCGKTTLGRELARILNFKHIDHEDYAFEKSEIPYTAERSFDKCVELMFADIEKSRGFVISAVTGNFGIDIEARYDLAVYIEAPLELRIERVKQRNLERFGERVLEGGDMYEGQKQFTDFVTSRSLSRIEQYADTLTCPVIRIDGTADYKQTAADIAARFYTNPGEPWRVYTAALGELKTYRFTVIFARYNGEWLYSQHKERDTYETAGGHIEPGESPMDCAKRELYEETGAVKFSIFPAFDYAVHTDTEFSYGQVFYADVQTLGELPECEMAEVCSFTTFPEKLTYPMILPILYDEMDKWLGRDNVIDEYWDVLDENRNLTGRRHRRIDDMPPGDYHLVVRAWIINSKGEFLITRRAFSKIGFPGMWEVPSGSAMAGEESLEATVREAKEECGIPLLSENGTMFSTYRRGNSFYDNWLFRQEFKLADVVLQEGETIDARAVTWQQISEMMGHGEFIGRDVFPEFELLEKVGAE